jgi:hypothetical protein
MDETNWQVAVAQPLLFTQNGSASSLNREGSVQTDDAPGSLHEASTHPFATLLRSFSVHPEIIRSRIQLPQDNIIEFRDPAVKQADHKKFQLTTTWSCR